MSDLEMNEDGSMLTVQIPITFQIFGGRKQIVSPPGENKWPSHQVQPDSAMIKALARAHRWKRLLENGLYSTVDDLAKAEKINPSYVSRVLRLTLLAPVIVEDILDGRHPGDLQLDEILKPFPVTWDEQEKAFRFRT